MTIEADAYKPEAMESVKRVFNRAIRYQLDSTQQPRQVFEASALTLHTLSPQELLLPWDLQKRLATLIQNLQQNHWQNDPEAGNAAINPYSSFNQRLRGARWALV